MSDPREKQPSPDLDQAETESRAPYEPPRITKKRSVARVTLFSGSGAAGTSGLTGG